MQVQECGMCHLDQFFTPNELDEFNNIELETLKTSLESEVLGNFEVTGYSLDQSLEEEVDTNPELRERIRLELLVALESR
jgi:hypothetical protein